MLFATNFWALLLSLFMLGITTQAQQTVAKGSTDEGSDELTVKGTSYALIIGISQYKEPRLRLNVADADAALFANFLLETKRVTADNMQVLLNKDANSAAVNRAVQTLRNKKLKEGDEVLIYFSGHGDIQRSTDTSTKGYIGYLLCSDVNTDRAYAGAQGTLSFKDLNETVEQLTRQGVLVNLVLDACHSGQTINEEGANLLSESALVSFRNTVRYLSCGPKQRSYENKELGHGYFTYYLVQGLIGLADILPTDNEVNVAEISIFTLNQVSASTQKQQAPNISGPAISTVVMQIPPEFKSIGFERLRTSSARLLQQDVIAARSLSPERLPGLTKPDSLQQQLLTAWNQLWQQPQQTLAALHLYKQYQLNKALPADWLEQMRFRLVERLSVDPQEAVNTILLGKNSLPPASYFANAAEKSKAILALLDSTDYGYRVQQIYSRYLEAYSYLRARNFRQYLQAQRLLHEALQLEPDAAFVLHALGRLAEYQNNYSLAEQYYRKAIELIPTWTYPRSSLGNVLRDQNRYREAQLVFEEVIRLAPQFSWPYNNLANVYYDLKRYREADRLYRYSIAIDSLDVSIEYSNLGLVHRDRGNIREAESFFRKSMAADSYFVYAYHHLAQLYKKVNARVTAELLVRSVALEPFYSNTLTELADYYREGPNPVLWQKADSLYQQAISNNPFDPWAYAGRAWLLAKQKDTSGALQLFGEAIRINPEKPAAYTNLGGFYQSARQYTEALQYYRKSLELSPYHWTGYQWMHETYLRMRQRDSAVYILQQARAYFEDNPELFNLLGNYYFSRGQYDSAAVYYNYTLQADSNYANAYGNLAYTDLELNRFDEALRYFYKAHTTDPLLFSMKQLALTLIDKADNLLLARETAAAEQLLQQGLNWMDVKQYSFFIKAASVYYLNGKYEKAIPLLERLLSDTLLTESFRYRILQLQGWCLLDKGNGKEAFSRFEQSLRYTPNPSYLGLAAALLAQQQITAAKNWIEKENKSNSNWKEAGRWHNSYSAATRLLLQQLKEWE